VKSASVFLALALAALVATGASAQSPKEIIFNENVLSAAVKDIMEMKRDELGALSRYLAHCDDSLSTNDVILHDCSVVRQTYEIEFANGRYIDKLLGAIRIASELLKRDTKNEHADLLLRYVDVQTKLRRIMNVRFGELRQESSDRRDHNLQTTPETR
jgi:hypothetical protein